MGKPAARVGDMHVCPMVTPGVPPIPHVGGPILPPGMPTVLIGGMPAATMGNMCTCTGPPDVIVLGSVGVMIGGKPAARMGDMCAHGGTIVVGCPTVLIGEILPAVVSAGAFAASMAEVVGELEQITTQLPGPAKAMCTHAFQMVQASIDGMALVHNPFTCTECSKEE